MRALRVGVGTLALLLLSIGVAGVLAQSTEPIVWTSGQKPLEVAPGESLEFEATFVSRVAIPDADAYATSSLVPLFGGQVIYLGHIDANRVYTVRYTIRAPQDSSRRTFEGVVMVCPLAKQGGLTWPYPAVLPVSIQVR